MKKFLSVVGLTTILGLGVYSIKNSDVSLPTSKDVNEKTFIVNVEGNLKGDKELLAQKRNKVLNQINYLLPSDSFEVTYTYDTLLNGFAIKTSGAYEDVLKKISGVTSVAESHTYAAPKADISSEGGVSTSQRKLILGNYSAETMGATAADVKKAVGTESKGGEGITIGIIDTGLYLNQVDGHENRTATEAELSSHGLTISSAAFKNLDADVTKTLTASDLSSAGLSHAYSSYNDKVIYGYDYADGDTDVNPSEAAGTHGTHVASLATANGDEFQGIAPNAQLAVMKVFSDKGGGAGDAAITKALEDSAKLGLDIVNLSLGTDLTDYDDTISDAGYQAVKKAKDAGVIVNFSAGNAGKSSFSGIYSNYAAGTVEPGILGSYANYDESANIVASSNPDKAYYSSIMLVKANGATDATAVSFDDQVKNRDGSTIKVDDDHFLTDLLQGEAEKSFNYLYVRGVGLDTDFEASMAANHLTDLKNMVAVVDRGDLSFTNKVKNAEAAGASAMIVVNNVSGTTFNFSFDWGGYSPSIPVVLVFQSMGSAFGAKNGMGSLTLSQNTVQKAPDGNMVSSFSSDGPGYNLDIAPTIAAPGGQVIGAVSAATPGTAYKTGSTTVAATTSGVTGYDNMSGTSMASPNLSGAMALALGETKSSDAATFKTQKEKLSRIAMASADQLIDASAEKDTASVRMQGAGRINVRKMLKSQSYLTYNNTESDAASWGNKIMSKAELKNTGSLKIDGGDFTSNQETYIEFPYTIHNDSNEDRSYKASLSVMIPDLSVVRTTAEYNAETAESKKDEFVKGLDKPTQSVNEDEVTVPEDRQPSEIITVKKGQSFTTSIKVRIDDLQFSKKWRSDGSTASTDFTGTLKEYFAKYFSTNGGSFVEGYLKLQDASETKDADLTMVMPYLGFYGDYTKGAAVEDFDFEKDDGRIYNSEITDNYVRNINSESPAYRPNAETGSYISATTGTLDTSTLQNIADMKASVRYGSSGAYKSIAQMVDGQYHLYAGATGISDTIVSTFFVERSISAASWEIKQGSKVVKKGDIYMMGWISDTFTGKTPISSMGLPKSWLGQSENRFEMFRAYSEISVTDVAEGDYTLSFNFTKRADNNVQVKSYPLSITRTAPTLRSISKHTIVEDGETYNVLDVEGFGSTFATDNGSQNVNMKKVSGSEGVYSGQFLIDEDAIKNDAMTITLTDYAHNEANILIKPSDLSFVVLYSKFTNKASEDPTKFTFDILQTSNKAGRYGYEISITDLKGNDVNPSKDYKLVFFLAKGLDADQISIIIDGEDGTFTYDAETGMTVLNMPHDASSIIFSHKPVIAGKSSGDDSSSSAPTSSSSAAPATDSTTPAPAPEKKGCGGSIAVASTLVGAAFLAGVGLVIKKRKEDK